ncbi:hypothetical protein K488DRAFT_83917 [Vararia minispora EC-137]|uniref:Uncharacterized protein n=1 Tax=Vararia minispora EC-137 TaxID=1314806 RepID=A0ACB8QS00_9AGAM|nr:hypothetical protein K488DRAFT_83917 [Vararia minispora EC-137]
MSATELEEGTYTIQHCTQKTLAVIDPSSGETTPISSGIPRKDRRGIEVWKIEKAGKGYQISHAVTGRYATGRKEGEPTQVSWSPTDIWEIKETRERNVYTIQPVDSQCCWTIDGGNPGYTVILHEEPYNKARSWWKFVATPVPPTEQTVSSAELAPMKFSSPPPAATPAEPRRFKLSGVCAFKVLLTGSYVKTTSSGQLYASSPYLDADAVFTAEERNGRCALQGSNYMYVVNRVGDAACDDIGADEDHRVYFDVIPLTGGTVCLATPGFGQTWYLASDNDNKTLFFQSKVDVNAHFNVVYVPPSARPFPPTFPGNVAIRCPGNGGPGKLLRVKPSGGVAFSGYAPDKVTEFTVDPWMARLVSTAGGVIGLTPTREVRCEEVGKTPQGTIQILDRPGNKFSIMVSDYPWQDGQTWFLGIQPGDPLGTVVVKVAEDETCHFSVEDRGKWSDPTVFDEVPPYFLQEHKVTIRNRHDRYIWASKEGELRNQSLSLDDSVVFSIIEHQGEMHIRGGNGYCIYSPHDEYAWCKGNAPLQFHLHFRVLQAERSSDEIVLALGDGKGKFLSTRRGEEEGSFTITSTLDDDCYLRIDIYNENLSRFTPFPLTRADDAVSYAKSIRNAII